MYIARDETAAGDDGGDDSRSLQEVRPHGEVDVDGNEDEKCPRQRMMDEANDLETADQGCDPAEQVVNGSVGVGLAVGVGPTGSLSV